jgi:SET domain-containing protein
MTEDGNHEPEINDTINKGRAAISKLNSILWDRDLTSKTKTHVFRAIVKSTITYAAETWCLKAKTVAKLKCTKTDFWRRSVRISRKDKIRNSVIKQTMNVTSSL